MKKAKTQLPEIIQALEAREKSVVISQQRKLKADSVSNVARQNSLEPLPELLGARYVSNPCAPLDASDWSLDLK